MKLCVFALLVSAIFVNSGCSQSESPTASNTITPAVKATATPDELASARVNYAKHCVECHGAQGEGGVKTVDKVRLKIPNLGEGHALKHTDEDFVEQIEKGGDGMPEFKRKLSPDEINLLVRFVRHEFQGK
jgi:mono/diheme cytochrome c family protein